MQLHLEFATPAAAEGHAARAGVTAASSSWGRYEIQVLDSHNNRTYADGDGGLDLRRNPAARGTLARKPGEWQSYDIIFEAPRFKVGRTPRPGISASVVERRHGSQPEGSARSDEPGHDAACNTRRTMPELPLSLQQHGNRVHFRNVWIRRLRGYDQKRASCARGGPSRPAPGQRGHKPRRLSRSSRDPTTKPIAPPAPAGFNTLRDGIARGKIETVEYDSKTVGTRRKALVYTPPPRQE